MTSRDDLAHRIEALWEQRAGLSPATAGDARAAVEDALALLDSGRARVAERGADGAWVTHQWLKKAVLLSFRLNDNRIIGAAPSPWFDKVPLKFADWSEDDFRRAGFRAVPGAVARKGAYIAPSVVLMPSFVNIGAHVGEGTMIDAWATVGSCAQIGRHCHISGGAGIGGVLEPLQANPVIIEDNCFMDLAARPPLPRLCSCLTAAWTNVTCGPPRMILADGRARRIVR